jgi:hypothetical protein
MLNSVTTLRGNAFKISFHMGGGGYTAEKEFTTFYYI